jgi:hypothetical protein
MAISSHHFRGAKTAARNRERIARTGLIMGKRLWQAHEDRALCGHYPNYTAARKALPGRTYYSVRGRACKLKIQNKRHIWTGADLVRMRKLYPTASKRELLAAFPGLTLCAIKEFAGRMHIFKQRRPFQKTSYPLLDAIRARCYELGYSMVDLDEIARTKRYFQCARWVASKSVQNSALCKAVDALDGTLSPTWRDA